MGVPRTDRRRGTVTEYPSSRGQGTDREALELAGSPGWCPEEKSELEKTPGSPEHGQLTQEVSIRLVSRTLKS